MYPHCPWKSKAFASPSARTAHQDGLRYAFAKSFVPSAYSFAVLAAICLSVTLLMEFLVRRGNVASDLDTLVASQCLKHQQNYQSPVIL